MDRKRWCLALDKSSLLPGSPWSCKLEGLHLFSPQESRSEGIALYR